MATLGTRFAANAYERERAERLMALAAKVAALAAGPPRAPGAGRGAAMNAGEVPARAPGALSPW
jgi:hypothetical protein